MLLYIVIAKTSDQEECSSPVESVKPALSPSAYTLFAEFM